MAERWPEPVERVAAVLRDAGVDARLEEFREGTPTARAAAKAVGASLGQIVKSLLFICDGRPTLALVPGDRRADETAIGAAVSASEVRVARPEEVVHATGFDPGGVAPFPRRAVTETLMDTSFFAHEVVWVGAGTESHMASLRPTELQRLAGARSVDLTGRG